MKAILSADLSKINEYVADINVCMDNMSQRNFDLQNLLAPLDILFPETLTRSKITIAFTPADKLIGKATYRNERTWFPNPGEDPNLRVYLQNDTNGYYVDNVIKSNFEFNDVLRLVGHQGAGSSTSNKLEFYSIKYDTKIKMELKQFVKCSRTMINNHIAGRWTFSGTTNSLTIRPVDYD